MDGRLTRMLVVAQRHPDATDDGPGTNDRPFRTISRAAALAGPGDTVRVHAGTYRESVTPARGGFATSPVTYEAVPGETVVIRGSAIYAGTWHPVPGYPRVVSTIPPDGFFPEGFNPFAITFDTHRGGGRQGQIFLDGREVFEAMPVAATDPVTSKTVVQRTREQVMYDQPGTWWSPDGRTLLLHLPNDCPAVEQCVVELSVRRRLFAPVRRGQDHVVVRGFVFEHCANDAAFPQVGAVSCRSGQHWLIENNVIRHIKTVGLDCGAEAEGARDIWRLPDTLDEDRFHVGGHPDDWALRDRRIAGRHLILNNVVSDCGQCGIAGLFSDGSVLMGNVVERCGRVVPGFESGGIKIHGLMAGTVEANLVRDNDSWGLWLDCGYIGSRVTRNVVVNNKPSGIFLELSEGPCLVDHNIVAANRGDGIYVHDAHGVVVAHNLMLGNTQFGLYMHIATDRDVSAYHYATGRQRIIGGCSWERIYNNIIIDNADGAISLPLPSPRVQDNRSDQNLFGGSGGRPCRFVLNSNNGLKGGAEAVKDAAREAFRRTGDSGLSQVELVTWKDKGAVLDLPQWRIATGNDGHSLDGGIRGRLDPESLELVLEAGDVAMQLKCLPVPPHDVRDFRRFERVPSCDFRGGPLDQDLVRPGPLQVLRPGITRIKVWPVPFERPPMPPGVEPKPAANARDLKPLPKPSLLAK